jgi:arylsulfatase I/J
LDEHLHVTDWYSTFCHLAGVDPKDPITQGTRSDGTKFTLPPIDSINMWDLISGARTKSPRREIPVCIDMPLLNGSSALIVDDSKLIIGPQQLSFWQGPAFPNGTDSEAYGQWPPYNMADCGKAEIRVKNVTVQKMEGGCLFNIREDPAETNDLAQEHPHILERLKQRYLELMDTGLDQRSVLLTVNARAKAYMPNWIQMLKDNRGFVGPWCTDGACKPAPPGEHMQDFEQELFEPAYGLGGPFPGFKGYGEWQTFEDEPQYV